MDVSKLYDLLAPVYGLVVPPMYDLATSRAAQRLSAGAPSTILEVGVGPGHILAAVGKKNAAAHAVGVDISMGMLKQSRRALGKSAVQADLVRADAIELPFHDRTFDGVVISFLLDVFPADKIPDALREMARVLAPGGRIVVASLRFSNPLVKQAWMLAYRVLPDVVGQVRPVDVNPYLDETGLRILQEEEIQQAAGTRLLTLMKVRG